MFAQYMFPIRDKTTLVQPKTFKNAKCLKVYLEPLSNTYDEMFLWK